MDPQLSEDQLAAEPPSRTQEESAAIRNQAAERISGHWSDDRFLDEPRRVVAADSFERAQE